jgi:hypothetical protein
MVFVDSHVHIHKSFNLPEFFDATWQNVQAAWQLTGDAGHPQAVLMLTEEAGVNWFEALFRHEIKITDSLQDWKIRSSAEDCSLLIEKKAACSIYLIAGRQIQTKEGLEVLALGLRRTFKDNHAMRETINRVKDAGGLPVIPWGFGKWIGARGKVIDQLIRDVGKGDLYIGDNGGRPRFLKEPKQFEASQRKGIKILRGSDPLPFAREYRRAGSYGFYFVGELSEDKPAEDLKQKLADPLFKLNTYGDPERFGNFIRNQLLMQIKKRFGKSIETLQ